MIISLTSYRIPALCLLCAFVVLFFTHSAPVHSQEQLCQIDKPLKRLEKKIVVEVREVYRLETSLPLMRAILLACLDPPTGICSPWKWQSDQPYLLDSSYKRFNRAILSSKHHPPTV